MSSAARTRTMLNSVVIAAMAATVGLLWGLSRSSGIERTQRDLQLAAFDRGEQIFLNRGNFIEFEDKLLVDVLPAADYSRGGAYFVGSSNLKWALKLWELPPRRRALIHNYGIGGTHHRHHFEFVRFLVDEQGLLEAGGEDTLVVLGVSYRSAAGQGDAYFEALWKRHGLYDYDPGRGPRQAGLSAFRRRMRLERARISSFVGVSANRAARSLALALGLPLSARFNLTDPAGIERMARNFDVPDPEQQIAEPVAQLENLIRYLKERHAAVSVVVLPERETVHDRSIPRAYLASVNRIAEALDVPLLDLTHLLAEDEFIDYNHANARGLEKLHPILLGLAERHVRARGLD